MAYYYATNAQGDVTGIVDKDCNTVVEYTYDSWGELLSTNGSLADTIGKVNPFLYRGYYFDSETGLYYLNSRYYDANTGRFVSSDSQMGTNQDLLSYNLFTYCSNNPINHSDPSGLFWGEIGNWFNSAVNAVVSTVKSVASTVSSWVSSAWNTTSTWFSNTFVSAGISSASYSSISKYQKTTHKMVKSHEANPRNEYVSRIVKVADSKPLKVIKNISKVCEAVSVVLTVKSFMDDTHLKNPGLAIGIDAAGGLASILAGVAIGFIGSATLPAVALGVILTGAVSVGIGLATDYAKRKYCN